MNYYMQMQYQPQLYKPNEDKAADDNHATPYNTQMDFDKGADPK